MFCFQFNVAVCKHCHCSSIYDCIAVCWCSAERNPSKKENNSNFKLCETTRHTENTQTLQKVPTTKLLYQNRSCVFKVLYVFVEITETGFGRSLNQRNVMWAGTTLKHFYSHCHNYMAEFSALHLLSIFFILSCSISLVWALNKQGQSSDTRRLE